jgi:hypothetical protein
MSGDLNSYASLSREALEQRLRVAEDICLMYGWSAERANSPREKAAVQLWQQWADLVRGWVHDPETAAANRPEGKSL